MNLSILVTVRLKSVRLPFKALLPINGRPMICHLLDRLKLSRQSQNIIICTSNLSQDDPLEDIAITEGVSIHRGHPDDVLMRITQAAKQFDLDYVISCTGDNPFTDPEYIDLLADFHCENHYDFSVTQGLPFGTFAYALSVPAMQKACEIKNMTDTEVWGGYFTETGLFSCGKLQVKDKDVFWPDLRLTVDTPQDYALILKIAEELGQNGTHFLLRDIVGFCRKHPEIVAMNKSIKQKIPVPISVKNLSQ